MATVQLRRYELAADDMDAFVRQWRRYVPIYHQFGFDVLFAFVDRDKHELVWAVSHPGDAAAFEEAKAAASQSPEWAAAGDGSPPRPLVKHASMVDVALATHAPAPAPADP